MPPELLKLLEDLRHELVTLHGLYTIDAEVAESTDYQIDVSSLLGRLDRAIASGQAEGELSEWIRSSIQGRETFP